MFIAGIGITLMGCSTSCPPPVKVPQKCVVPVTECNKYKYSGLSIEEELTMCITELRRNSMVCQ